MKTIDVVVIGKNYSTSLGIIKAVGQCGYNCAVIKLIKNTPRFKTPEIKSKYVQSFVYAKDLDDDDVINSILKYKEDKRKKVAIPADDYSASLLDRYYDLLCNHFFIPNINKSAYALTAFMDKYRQKELADTLSFSSAKRWKISIKDNHYLVPRNVTYPCITKPLISIGAPKSYIKLCVNREELLQHLNCISKELPCDILIEEAIDIKDEYTVPGLSINGDVYIPALLQKKVVGSGKHRGVTIKGVVIEATKYDELIRKLKEYISITGFTGLFDVELFESHGFFYLNEVNLRYSAAGYAVTKAGANLPGVYVDYLLKNRIPNKKPIKDGVIFISDKAALDDYDAGFSSFQEYKEMYKNVDIKFLCGNEDFPSKLVFWLLIAKTIVRKRRNNNGKYLVNK